MMRVGILATSFIFAFKAVSLVNAGDLTKSTFTISGLHCPPCTRTVQSALVGVPGIKSASVDWKTKSARIDFDQDMISVQQIAQRIANTPHMMGGGMHYRDRLALSVPAVKDDASATAVTQALQAIQGVKAVAAFPAQHTISIAFDDKGNLTMEDLIAALEKAGFKATSY